MPKQVRAGSNLGPRGERGRKDPLPQFHRGLKLGNLGRTDSRHPAQLVQATVGQSLQSLQLLEQLDGHLDGRGIRPTHPQQNG